MNGLNEQEMISEENYMRELESENADLKDQVDDLKNDKAKLASRLEECEDALTRIYEIASI